METKTIRIEWFGSFYEEKSFFHQAMEEFDLTYNQVSERNLILDVTGDPGSIDNFIREYDEFMIVDY
jgi:acetolactate synthase small subunit